MKENKDIHRILEYVCMVDTQSNFDTMQLSENLNLSLSETNNLVRNIFENGDALEYKTQCVSEMGALGLQKTVATKDAFETQKYLKATNSNDNRFNLYISTDSLTYNILDITEVQLMNVVKAYSTGKSDFTLNGVKYWLENLMAIKIFVTIHPKSRVFS